MTYTIAQIEALLTNNLVPCDPCGQPSVKISNRMMLDLLVIIANGIEDLNLAIGGATPVHWLPMTTVDTGEINDTFQEFLADAHEKAYISVVNYGDQPLIFSRDGSVELGIIGANGGSVTLNFGSNRGSESGSIWLKNADEQVSPDSKVYISAYYLGDE